MGWGGNGSDNCGKGKGGGGAEAEVVGMQVDGRVNGEKEKGAWWGKMAKTVANGSDVAEGWSCNGKQTWRKRR